MSMSEELLITVNEAARRLGVGKSLMYMIIRRGELPSVKIAGARRVAVAELQEYVSRLRAEAREADAM
jgi:excisionase family DNA binding protein